MGTCTPGCELLVQRMGLKNITYNNCGESISQASHGQTK